MKVARLLSATILCWVMWCSVFAQTLPSATASIRGAATLGGEPLPGLGVWLRRHLPSSSVVTIARTETDAEGKYRFNNLPAGRYYVEPLSPHLVPTKEELLGSMSRSIDVAEGEIRDNINLDLKRGGVITGRITDADGYPVIGQPVWYERVDEQGKEVRGGAMMGSRVQTDDCGIYRLFGLLPGRYHVYVGDRALKRVSRSMNMHDIPLTFYPGTQDAARAGIIEVVAGGEVTGDIKLSATERTFQVLGRVIDAQTGAPLPWIPIGYGTDQVNMMSGEVRTNERGEFRYDGFPPGNYSFYACPSLFIKSEYYSDRTLVEIGEKDVEGVIVKAYRGATISGWVTFEGAPTPAVLAQLSELRISPSLQSREPHYAPESFSQRIDPDGRITFSGLRPGKYWFTIGRGIVSDEFNLLRIEHQGVVQESGIEVTAGSNPRDVRFVISSGTGGIRGRIRTNNQKIELPANAFLQVSVRPTRNRDHLRGADVRANQQGNFIVEGLMPGEYEIRVDVNYDPRPERSGVSIGANRQLIVVKQSEIIEVVLPVEIINQGRQ